MKRQQADPTKDWRDITDRHEEAREDIKSVIKEDLSEGKGNDPRAIVGPYRSGKTQLLYYAFNKAWEEGVPALYVDVRQIFREYEQRDAEADLIQWTQERVQQQVRSLADGNPVDWLPNFNTYEERDSFLDEAEKKEITDSSYTVLLVDEVEQAYTQLKDIEELINTEQLTGVDDSNPLRVFLDQTTGIYHIWSFGLISAFEFLNEADDGRFTDRRIPPLGVKEVYEWLEDRGKPPAPAMANGIWWLSRGRVGQVNKFIREVPEDVDRIPEYIRDKSGKEFENTKIVVPVWEDVLKRDVKDARKTIVFSDDSYEDWRVSGPRVTSEDFQNAVLEVLIGDAPVSSDAERIIEQQLSRLVPAFAPALTWEANGDEGYTPYLPASLLYDEERVDGFLSLLQDLIATYIRQHNTRDEALQLIQQTDRESFRNAWIGRITEFTGSDTVWSIDPGVVNDAYPAVAINPDNLTDKRSNRLRQEMNEGVEIVPNIDTPHIDLHVYLCPTESAFNTRAAQLVQSLNFTEVSVLLTPPETEWTFQNDQATMANLNRLHHVSRGSERLWDFVAQLDEYIASKGEEPPYDEATVESVVADEEDRQTRTTVETLFLELNRIVQEEAADHYERFVQHYSRENVSVPLWGEKHLDSEGAFWVHGGSLSVGTAALSYGFVFSPIEIDPNAPYSNLRQYLISAHDEDLMEGNFKLADFLNRVLKKQKAFGASVDEQRERYNTISGSLATPARRLQQLLAELVTGIGVQSRVSSIRNIENEPEEITILNSADLQYEQAPAMLWGLLFNWAATRDDARVESRLSELVSDLKTLENKLETVREEVKDLDETISPPYDDVASVNVELGRLDKFEENVTSVRKKTEDLHERVAARNKLRTVGFVYHIILERYEKLMRRGINDLHNEVTTVNIANVERLNGTYREINRMLEEDDRIVDYVDESQGEMRNALNSMAGSAFNYKNAVGGQTIEPGTSGNNNGSDKISAINEHAGEWVDEFNDVLRALDGLVDALNDLESQSESTRGAMTEFLEDLAPIEEAETA
jgi:hypothetical protein